MYKISNHLTPGIPVELAGYDNDVIQNCSG